MWRPTPGDILREFCFNRNSKWIIFFLYEHIACDVRFSFVTFDLFHMNPQKRCQAWRDSLDALFNATGKLHDGHLNEGRGLAPRLPESESQSPEGSDDETSSIFYDNLALGFVWFPCMFGLDPSQFLKVVRVGMQSGSRAHGYWQPQYLWDPTSDEVCFWLFLALHVTLWHGNTFRSFDVTR